MSHVLYYNRAADGVERKSWLVILLSFQRRLHPFGIQLKMFECVLAGTTVQGFSSCDEALSSMYLGEVSSNEVTHLDKEVAYISHMRWGGFTMLLHKGVTAAKVEAMQMW